MGIVKSWDEDYERLSGNEGGCRFRITYCRVEFANLNRAGVRKAEFGILRPVTVQYRKSPWS
jgi:hypothetical protein